MRSRAPALAAVVTLAVARAVVARAASPTLPPVEPVPPAPFASAAPPDARRLTAPPAGQRRRTARAAVAGLVAAPALAFTGVASVAAPGQPAATAAADTPAGEAVDPVAHEELLAERTAAVEAAELRASRDAAVRAQAARERAEREAAALAEAARPKTVTPVDGPVGSPFGYRWGRLHAGLDFPAPLGTPIRAAADGVVEKAGPASGYGNLVTVRHADGVVTAYGHMRVIDVVPGQPVLAGQVIAQVGNEGRSTGPHLHFEARAADGPRDPRLWLAGRGVVV